MERKPLTKMCSPWVEHGTPVTELFALAGVPNPTAWTRNVHDGRLLALVAQEPTGWHLSISHPRRYPTWDEIAHARYELLPGDITMAMLLPPMDEYVAVHDHAFHLHQLPETP